MVRLTRDTLESALLKDTVDLKEIVSKAPFLEFLFDCSQNHPAHRFDVLEHTSFVVNNLAPRLPLRLVGLLHDIGKKPSKFVVDGVERFKGHELFSVNLAIDFLTKLGYTSVEIDYLAPLILHHDKIVEPTRESFDELCTTLGSHRILDFLEHRMADLNGHSEAYITKHMPMTKEVDILFKSYLA